MDTNFAPDTYAVFIYSRWVCHEPGTRAARIPIEFRIQKYIEIRGTPKTVMTEKRAAVAALRSLGFMGCAKRVSALPLEKILRSEQIERFVAQ